ncbi:MAG: alpha/beta fold hydrolase [Spirochaetaceae bacterium]|nr:alpha/beta fold hydrolase [Spirochaetaceae bacterium]
MSKANEGSFSTQALEEALRGTPTGTLLQITASDLNQLAVHFFPAKGDAQSSILFLHGGGAHGLAGYQYLANQLSTNENVNVYLMDLRGHGLSQGPRGDTPSVEQVWQDVKTLMEYILEDYGEIPILLGGHSSGSGLLLNYISWKESISADGYIFISPYLGYKSSTERENNDTPFATADSSVFVSYYMSNGDEDGNTPAVFFNYSSQVLENDPLLITSITVQMSLAMTADRPKEQFKAIDKPFCLFIGEEDELLDPQGVMDYGDLPPSSIKDQSICAILPEELHLSMLLNIHEPITQYLLKAEFISTDETNSSDL